MYQSQHSQFYLDKQAEEKADKADQRFYIIAMSVYIPLFIYLAISI